MIYCFSIIVAVIILLLSLLYLFYNKKKADVKITKEIKISQTTNKQNTSSNKKSKKKFGKKAQTESEFTNMVGDAPIESDKNEEDSKEICDVIDEIIPVVNVTEEMTTPVRVAEEMSTPLKAADESNVQTSKKKNRKSKQTSGDQLFAETEKNDNQSNTLIGRNTDEKLKEEIQSLQKILDDYKSEKQKNENSLIEIKSLIETKENENKRIKTELMDVTSKLNVLMSGINSEKQKMDQISSEKNKTQKEIEDLKCKMTYDNTAHRDMYKNYENKLENLNNQIKKYKLEEDNLNKGLKDEMEKTKVMKIKYDKVDEILSKKLEEFKLKDNDYFKLQELNETLKRTVEDLQKSVNNKELEFKNRFQQVSEVNNQLNEIIEKFKDDIGPMNCKLEEGAKTEICLIENIKKLENEITTKDLDYNTKISEMDEKVIHLQVIIHNLRKEIEQKCLDIETLEESNAALLQKAYSDDEVEEIKKIFAQKEIEFITKYQSLEESNNVIESSINALEETIEVKNREIQRLLNEEVLNKEMITSLNSTNDDIKKKYLSKEEIFICKESEMNHNIIELNEIINMLQKEIESKVSEIEETKKSEILVSEKVSYVTEELHKATASKEDFLKKLKELTEHNTHLEIFVHDQKKEMDEKILEMDNLKESNFALLKEISLIKIEFDVLKTNSNTKEETLIKITNDDELLVQKLNENIEALSAEIDVLRNDLGKKETQVEELIENTSVLLRENKSLKKNSDQEIEELNKKITTLIEENKSSKEEQYKENGINEKIISETEVQLMTETCDMKSDVDEIQRLKFHIKKLENELVQMQGRYYVLKEDTFQIKIENGVMPNQNVITDTVLLSIPPLSEENCIQSSENFVDNRDGSHDSLQEAINRLNSEIEEQRLTNQKLSGDLQSKQNEVITLKQCLLGLDGSLNNIGNMANELQKTCSLTQVDRSAMKCQNDTLLKDHEVLRKRYEDLEKKLFELNESIHKESNDNDAVMSNKMKTLYEENDQLKLQLEQYRDSLEKTEKMLENIQSSVDVEEIKWTTALRSSEQDCNRLELSVKDLSMELEEMKRKDTDNVSDMIASISTINNGTVSSDLKKKRKRKNKNKKKKNRVSEFSGN